MSAPSRQKLVRTRGRFIQLFLVPVSGLIILFLIFSYYAYNTSFDRVKAREQANLNGLVKTLAGQIDGDMHEALMNEYQGKDAISSNEQDPRYAKLQALLHSAQVSNGLATDIYTLIRREGLNASNLQDGCSFLITSSNPYFRHLYTPPAIIAEKFNEGGLIDPYESANGTWISAFAPIKNSEGKVIAVVEADQELSEFYDTAYDEVKGDLAPFAILVLVLIVIIIILIRFAVGRIVKNNDKMHLGHQKDLEETQTKITAFTQHLEKGEFDRFVTTEEEQNNPVIRSLQSLSDHLKAARQADDERKWVSEGLAGFGKVLQQQHQDLGKLSNEILRYMVKYLNAQQGSLYIVQSGEEGTTLELSACFAYDRQKFNQQFLNPGDGLVGQCYLDKAPIYLTDVPEGYLSIRSGLGDEKPANILIMPILDNDVVHGVLEFAAFHLFGNEVQEFLQRSTSGIASMFASVKNNLENEKLLEETKNLAGDLRAQEEELRQNQEEMMATQEEMNRKLTECQAELEAKEEELAILKAN